MTHQNSVNKTIRIQLQVLLMGLFFMLVQTSAFAEEHGGGHEEKGEENIGEVILDHIRDNHDWHVAEFPNFKGGGIPVAIHLPWIIYNSENGLELFGNTHKLLEHPNYILVEGQVHYVESKTPVHISEAELEANPDKYLLAGEGDHKMVYVLKQGVTLLDFSITKTSLQILILCLILLFVFLAVARGYKKREGMAPKGIQSFFEPIVVFVRDNIAKTFLHDKADKFLPYLLSLFFFIWFANLMGLLPINSNIAGNISVTVALALLTFILIVFNANKEFWGHIFWFPGVPIFIKPLMFVVEFLGLLTKPFALAIRLFANISAGHFMVLSLVSLIFILGKSGESIGGAAAAVPLSMVFSIFIFCLEMLVALVQAYVFSLLTAVFIGQAMESHGDSH